jgi:hypothetical protein
MEILVVDSLDLKPLQAGAVGRLADALEASKPDIPSFASFAFESQAEVDAWLDLPYRLFEHFGERMSDTALFKAIGKVRRRKQCTIMAVYAMSLPQFNTALDEAMGQAAKPQTDDPVAPAKTVATDELVGRLLTHTGDETALKVLSIARDQSRTVEERMQALVAVDCRYQGYNSEQWADFLEVSSPAIRQTDFWKTRKQRKEWGG